MGDVRVARAGGMKQSATVVLVPQPMIMSTDVATVAVRISAHLGLHCIRCFAIPVLAETAQTHRAGTGGPKSEPGAHMLPIPSNQALWQVSAAGKRVDGQMQEQ